MSPDFRIRRGNPTPEETAVAVAVLQAAAAAAAATAVVAAGRKAYRYWGAAHSHHRSHPQHIGAGMWSRSLRLR